MFIPFSLHDEYLADGRKARMHANRDTNNQVGGKIINPKAISEEMNLEMCLFLKGGGGRLQSRVGSISYNFSSHRRER